MSRASAWSFCGVEVPCALTVVTTCAAMRAAASACSTAAAAPAPSGRGDVGWYTSDVLP